MSRSVQTAALALIASLGIAPAGAQPEAPTCPHPPPVLIGPFTIPMAGTGSTAAPGAVLTGMGYGDALQAEGREWAAISRFGTRWFKDGEAIGEGKTYRVTASDAGSVIQQVVQLHSQVEPCPAWTHIGMTSPVRVVAPTKLTVKTSKTIRASQRANLRIKVASKKAPKAVGLVTVRWKGTGRGSTYTDLRRAQKGKTTLRLPRLKPGTYRITTRYTDTTGRHTTSKTTTRLTVRH